MNRSENPIYEQLANVISRKETRKFIEFCETQRVIDKETANAMHSELEKMYRRRCDTNAGDLDRLVKPAFSGDNFGGRDPEPILLNLLQGGI